MIPVRLTMMNFLPYRTPDPVLFEGVHLACLTGQNGAGKSALLDAITWALWGTARGKRDDDLVFLGQKEMHVTLDFEQEGVTYRVHRRRESGKRGRGSLEAFVIQADGNLQTITEGSMRETQSRINTILHLDYETFVNSAFLQQGKADAFTTKTPAERKRILSDILGLDRWRVFEDRAKRHLSQLHDSLTGINGQLDYIEEELATEGQIRRELEIAEVNAASAKEAVAVAEASVNELADAPANLNNRRNEQATITRRIKGFEQDLERAQQDRQQAEKDISTHQDVMSMAEAVEAGYASLKEARDLDQALGGLLRQLRTLDEDINRVKGAIEAQRAELVNEATGYRTSINDLQSRLDEDVSAELDAVREKIAALEAVEKERDTLTETVGKLREETSALKVKKTALTEEGRELNERIDRLKDLDEATCPLCGQPLDEAHRQELVTALTTERDQKREEWRQAHDRINEIDATLKSHDKTHDQLAEQIAGLAALRGEAGKLAQIAEDRDEASARHAQLTQQLNSIETTLADDDYAHDDRARLAELTAERDALGYDETSHNDARDRLQELNEFEAKHQQLAIAREAIPNLQKMLDGATERIERVTRFIDEEQTELTRVTDDIQTLEIQVQEHRQRVARLAELRTAESQANGAVTTAQQQLIALDTQRQRRERLHAQRDLITQEQGLYEQLKQAFGKNGVPAMMIEAAIPELETAANELLGRMSNGRMHLRLTTQTTNVDGSTRETLEIEIADELGTRSYEMYSGGESFRINFAVRVALSKMLARRAGAHLRTLFIDEGFGTQDDEGRTRLIEAINAVQDDFDLILVITHIDDLRDAFPVHILVDKTPSGSRIQIQ